MIKGGDMMLSFLVGFNLATLVTLMLINYMLARSTRGCLITLGAVTLLLLLIGYWGNSFVLLGVVTGFTLIFLMLTHLETM